MPDEARINLRALAAVSLVASSETVTRHYLCGVCLEITEDATIYVATDGHRLVAHYAPLGEKDERNTLTGTFIIPTLSCRHFKLKTRETGDDARLSRRGDDQLSLFLWGDMHNFAPIDGTFPDWRRVMPREVNLKRAYFDGDYVASFNQVARKLGHMNGCMGKTYIAPNGDDAALVTFPESAGGPYTIGVLMPIRGHANAEAPAWHSAPVPVKRRREKVAA
jgi:hypothetical protein